MPSLSKTKIKKYTQSLEVFSPFLIENSSAKAAGLGPVRISIIVVRKIKSVFINRHGAKCEPAYHPSWSAYKVHS